MSEEDGLKGGPIYDDFAEFAWSAILRVLCEGL
jgi:hypothetical protein